MMREAAESGVPSTLNVTLDGDISFDGVEEAHAPQYHDGMGASTGDGFDNGVPFEGSALAVSPFDGGVSCVGGLEVVF